MRWVFERRISFVKFKMHHKSCLRATKYQCSYSHKKRCFTSLIVGGRAVTTGLWDFTPKTPSSENNAPTPPFEKNLWHETFYLRARGMIMDEFLILVKVA